MGPVIVEWRLRCALFREEANISLPSGRGCVSRVHCPYLEEVYVHLPCAYRMEADMCAAGVDRIQRTLAILVVRELGQVVLDHRVRLGRPL